MITLKKNDYVKPTEIRENVVQDIIDAFLARSCWKVCHLCNDGDGMYRRWTRFVLKRKGEKAYGFSSETFSDNDCTEFHECEMKRAFELLIEAGYYMFEVYTYGTWRGYVCGNRDYFDGGRMVTTFTEHWD